MRRRLILAAAAALVALIGAVIVIFAGAARSIPFDFNGPAGRLTGDLILPQGDGPFPVVILVHGDGPTPRDGFGYYQAWRPALARAGYASLSWDKPGVGGSEGDWLAQSMAARAREIRAAAAALRHLDVIDPGRIGLMSFSQGVWAAPRAAIGGDFAFLISISGPMNWIRQGRDMTHARLAADHAGPREAARAIACARLTQELLDARAPHRAYLRALASRPDCGAPMSAARWGFVLNNNSADATSAFEMLEIPVLGLFGALDGNLDPQAEAASLRAALAGGSPRARIEVIADADHALTPATTRRVMDGAFSRDNVAMIGRALLLEEGALADGVFDLVVDWLNALPGAG